MPKVSDEHRAARREEIIDAALRAFTRNGYQRTSMADIISESGLSAGAIYGYFEGKQDLLYAVAVRVLDQRRAEIAAAGVDHVPSPSKFISIVLQSIVNAGLNPVVIQLWGEATVDPTLRPIVQRVFARMHETILVALRAWGAAQPGRLPDDPAEVDAIARAMVSFGPGFLLQSQLVDDFDAAAFIRAIPAVMRLEDPAS